MVANLKANNQQNLIKQKMSIVWIIQAKLSHKRNHVLRCKYICIYQYVCMPLKVVAEHNRLPSVITKQKVKSMQAQKNPTNNAHNIRIDKSPLQLSHKTSTK